MMSRIRKTIREKGQGLTEYVLILAFIAGIAFMMFGGDGSLKGTVVDTFTETHKILAGLFEDQPDWGHMEVNASNFNDSNQEARLKADQKALENLAKFFFTKTKDEVRALLSGNGDYLDLGEMGGVSASDVVLLGWFVKNEAGGTEFVTTTTSEKDSTKTIYSYLNESKTQEIFNWMQGDYGENGYSTSYDDQNKYLVSDYTLNNGWTNSAYGEGNGVKLVLKYGDIPQGKSDGDRPVVAAKIAIDSFQQKKTRFGKENASSGLELGLKKDSTGNIIVKVQDTGISKNFNF